MSSTEFCGDVIEEILVRLEAKSLIRFKSVSKDWSLLLSDSKFTRRNLLKSTSISKHSLILVNDTSSYFSIVTVHEKGDHQRIVVRPVKLLEDDDDPFFYKPQGCVFLGHCDGLLCLQMHKYSQVKEWGGAYVCMSAVCVWNPLTKERKIFPMSDLDPRIGGPIMDHFSFGYDVSTNDYKIVRLIVNYDFKNTKYSYKIESLRLTEGSWKEAPSSHDGLFLIARGLASIHVNGSLYWRSTNINNEVHKILSFDLSTDRMKEEETLSEGLNAFLWNIGADTFYNLFCFRDEQPCLGMVLAELLNSSHTYNVWMVEENEEKSWVHLFRVEIVGNHWYYNNPFGPGPATRLNGLIAISFTRDGKILVFSSDSQAFMLYQVKDELVEKVSVLGYPDFLYFQPRTPLLFDFVESLVSPIKI